MTATDHPNVLLLVMDTARAETVLDDTAVMPNLAAIAAEGTTFTNAFSTGPWTLPSHASLFTGQYTSEHRTHVGAKQFDPDVPPLAERVRQRGYRTVGISNNTWISPDFGFDRGFDDFSVGWQLTSNGAELATVARENEGTAARSRAILSELLSLDGPQTLLNALYAKFAWRRYDDGAWMTNRRIDRWLDSWDGERPFFMFVNYLEPHLEYDPPRAFRDRFVPDEMSQSLVTNVNQDAWSYIAGLIEMNDHEFDALAALYKAELNYLDHRIGRLYERLDQTGVLDDTVVIIAGDHGENLGDHGLMDHQYCLYDTLLHVPLVIRYPDTFDEGRRRTDLVELRDLYPTILDLCDVDRSDELPTAAHSLVDDDIGRPYVIGEYLTPQPPMETLETRLGTLPQAVRQFDRALRSVRTDEWKYIEGSDESTELYDLTEDPDETTNVAAQYPERCTEFAQLLRDRIGTLSSPAHSDTDMNAATKKRLDDIGYF